MNSLLTALVAEKLTTLLRPRTATHKLEGTTDPGTQPPGAGHPSRRRQRHSPRPTPRNSPPVPPAACGCAGRARPSKGTFSAAVGPLLRGLQGPAHPRLRMVPCALTSSVRSQGAIWVKYQEEISKSSFFFFPSFCSESSRAKFEHQKQRRIPGLICEHLVETSRIRSENILVMQRVIQRVIWVIHPSLRM